MTSFTRAIERCREEKRQLLIVEDGGYVATLLRDNERGPEWSKDCIGIVEQTKNGIWITENWQKNQEDYNNPLSVSVIDVANTALKTDGESPLIGRSVVDNLTVLMKEYEEQDLRGYGALLVGCGATGCEIGKALIAEGCNLTVVDERPLDQIRCPEGAVYKPLEGLSKAIAGNKFIIGATGQGEGTPLPTSTPPFDRPEHFWAMDNNAVLVNASSKKAEFSWRLFGDLCATTSRQTKRGFGYSRELRNGVNLRVAADGFPINFYNSQSVPAQKIRRYCT